jgi:hypothetical protein
MTDDSSLPYERAWLMSASVTAAARGGIVSDGFGTVVIRALEGRSLAVEVTEELSGLTVVAVLDLGRPRRARANLQADALCDAVRAASREDGLPVPFPWPH